MIFQYNDILFSEIPYACVVKKEYKSSICSNCFSENKKLLKCTQCNENCYCNKDCQKKDWKQHKFECKSFSANKIYPNDITLLILRLIIRSKSGGDSTPFGMQSNSVGVKPRCFDDLVSNLDEDKSNISSNFQAMFNELTVFLQQINIKIDEFIPLDTVQVIFSKSVTNNFEIQNNLCNTIGYGCYLNASGLNHSCWPNSVYTFQNNRLVLKALKRIELGDQLFINYTDPLQLRAERRSRLLEQYLFECQCEACSDDQLEREMSQLFCCQPSGCQGTVQLIGDPSQDYQCDKCGYIETKSEMNFRHSIYKAKLFHINNLMLNSNYEKSYELSRRELDEFNLKNQKENSGGLYQLSFGEHAFESAIFLGDYQAALEICQLKSGSRSWIHERLVRFLGTENHPIARSHLEKYKKLIEYLS